MTAPITPGTPVTVVLRATYERRYESPSAPHEDGPQHVVRAEDGRLLALADDIWSVLPASDGSDPTALTPAIRSLAHRAARDAGVDAPLNVAVEAALSAIEPVVAGLLDRTRRDTLTGAADRLDRARALRTSDRPADDQSAEYVAWKAFDQATAAVAALLREEARR